MEFVGTWWSLVPPIVAIVLALVTKETFSSLFVGIFVGAFLLALQSGDLINVINYVILGEFGEGDTGVTIVEFR